MGIRLDDAGGFKDLMEHEYHKITLATYLHTGEVINIAIECLDCNEVLLSFDKPSLSDLWAHLGGISIDEDDKIEQAFLHFPVGTERMDVWLWFDRHGFRFPWVKYNE